MDKAFDSDPATRWSSGAPQRPGTLYELDLGNVRTIGRLVLTLGASPNDYPRDLQVFVSVDGTRWEKLEGVFPLSSLVDCYINRRPLEIELTFEPTMVRYVRFSQEGRDKIYYWSIHELHVYEHG